MSRAQELSLTCHPPPLCTPVLGCAGDTFRGEDWLWREGLRPRHTAVGRGESACEYVWAVTPVTSPLHTDRV